MCCFCQQDSQVNESKTPPVTLQIPLKPEVKAHLVAFCPGPPTKEGWRKAHQRALHSTMVTSLPKDLSLSGGMTVEEWVSQKPVQRPQAAKALG